MSLTRIIAIIKQELYVTRHSLEVIIDLFYFSLVNIIVFGFFSLFLAGGSNRNAASFLLFGMIMWEVIRVTQYSISVGSLWNIWSRNLSNMFVAPLSITEYLIAEVISGIAKALLTVCVISIIAIYIFHFNIFTIGLLTFVFSFINLTIFAWSVGIFILGLIFRYGTRIQALAWGLVFIFQPLSATFFPVTILPHALRIVAYFLPPTYVFEAGRESLLHGGFNLQMTGISFLENICYLLLAIYFFKRMFDASKKTGQFAKNEG